MCTSKSESPGYRAGYPSGCRDIDRGGAGGAAGDWVSPIWVDRVCGCLRTPSCGAWEALGLCWECMYGIWEHSCGGGSLHADEIPLPGGWQ